MICDYLVSDGLVGYVGYVRSICVFLRVRVSWCSSVRLSGFVIRKRLYCVRWLLFLTLLSLAFSICITAVVRGGGIMDILFAFTLLLSSLRRGDR